MSDATDLLAGAVCSSSPSVGTHASALLASIQAWPRRSDRFWSAPRILADQASAADSLVDEALDAGLDGSHPVTVQAKMLRLELLSVKADLERELAHLVLDCSRYDRTVHWVAGLGIVPGHWAHREPAPLHEPAV